MSSTLFTPTTRTAYPSDVSDEEWAFVARYLVLLAEDTGRRRCALRAARGRQWPALACATS